MRRTARFFMGVITLQRPGSFSLFVVAITVMLIFIPYEWLQSARLSLYERMGIPSPSIGLTRAYWLLLHGQPVAAWRRNMLIYPILVVVILLIARDLYTLTKNRSEQTKQRRTP